MIQVRMNCSQFFHLLISLSLDATVRFSQAMYTVDESNGVVQILLILSNPSSTTLNITVLATDKSANGKYITFMHTLYYNNY